MKIVLITQNNSFTFLKFYRSYLKIKGKHEVSHCILLDPSPFGKKESFITKALKTLFRDPEYLMTYFHPRDFDPDQPIVPGLSISRRFKSYVGLSKSYNKLESLLKKYEFISLQAATAQIDWEVAPIVEL